MCICASSLACACVAAGSGDLSILRLFRELRWKTEDVTYGTHMALSMAVGLLFLGGGGASLRRDDEAIGSLLIAILPRYPSRTTDNQYYLQPIRHLYALATEHRLIRVEDVDSGEQLRVPIQVRLKFAIIGKGRQYSQLGYCSAE